jgi:hypothetical protein
MIHWKRLLGLLAVVAVVIASIGGTLIVPFAIHW